jgi:hypothetical protein
MLNGEELPVRPNLGIYTQPISFIGLPVVAVQVPLKSLPIAVQIIAPPGAKILPYVSLVRSSRSASSPLTGRLRSRGAAQ